LDAPERWSWKGNETLHVKLAHAVTRDFVPLHNYINSLQFHLPICLTSFNLNTVAHQQIVINRERT